MKALFFCVTSFYSHCKIMFNYITLQTMNSEEEMCDHVRECHSDLPFICVVCGQTLRTNAAFQRHMDIHKGLRGSACEVCWLDSLALIGNQ